MSDDSEPFPRGKAVPKQSPMFWVADKDRYLRQLLLRDLQERFGRAQFVYFTRCDTNAQIDSYDDRLLLELINGHPPGPIDLHIETNGGYTDAAEKLLTILKPYCKDMRVIVARRAKSSGTLLALAGSEIVMGPGSELGPIDPFINLGPGQTIPAHFILQAPNADPIIRQIAEFALTQTQRLATDLLSSGQMAAEPSRIPQVVDALSTRNTYPSHGSVIDAFEAKSLGLKVDTLSGVSDDWKLIWLLRCIYEQDLRKSGLVKLFESASFSNGVQAAA